MVGRACKHASIFPMHHPPGALQGCSNPLQPPSNLWHCWQSPPSRRPRNLIPEGCVIVFAMLLSHAVAESMMVPGILPAKPLNDRCCGSVTLDAQTPQCRCGLFALARHSFTMCALVHLSVTAKSFYVKERHTVSLRRRKVAGEAGLVAIRRTKGEQTPELHTVHSRKFPGAGKTKHSRSGAGILPVRRSPSNFRRRRAQHVDRNLR